MVKSNNVKKNSSGFARPGGFGGGGRSDDLN